VDWWPYECFTVTEPPLERAVRIEESALKERTLASEGFHEPLELLDEATVDRHRAMTSLCEELEAIDWYDQRVKATSDESLAAVLAYNRDDEKEHAAMALEWLRRRDPALDANLRKFLFTSAPITELGDEGADSDADGGPALSAGGSGSLGIGSLKGAVR
jgi:ferritin-like protein